LDNPRNIWFLVAVGLLQPVLAMANPLYLPRQQAMPADEEGLESSLIDEKSLFVPAPREVLRPLLLSQQAIQNGEYSRAVALLGEILADSGTEDFLVGDPDQEGIAISLRQRANDLLSQVPRKSRELYELKYGIQAQQLLDQAVQDLDYYQMAQIMRRFFHTRAGIDATMLVGYNHLDEGRPIAAAFCFQRVVDVEEARAIHDPEASVLLATCWMLADNETKATNVLLDLRRRGQYQKIRFLGKEIPLFANDELVMEWLRNLVGDSPLGSNALVYDWVMHRGNPQRNASSGSGFPLINARWSLPTLNDPNLERIASDKLQELIFSEASTVPSVHPIAVGDTIVMRTFNQMIGVDFTTGRRIWSYPALETEYLFADENLDQQTLARDNQGPIEQRLFQDSVYGQMSSDGQLIFVVPQPGFADGKRSKLVLRGGFKIDHPLAERSYNELIAVDVARQGAFKWEVGGKDGLKEPGLAEAFFLGPPLPLNGSLYVVCEQAGEIRLVVLDPETGKMSWQQQLASTETAGSVAKLPDRRLAGATPSFSDGVLVCPTGHGAIVAVDVSTRSLLWGFQYGSAKNRLVPRISHDQNSSATIVDASWKDCSVTISGGIVIYTPSDRNDLICLDLISGRPMWGKEGVSVPWLQREDSLFVGAVEKQQLLLVGLDHVRSIDLTTGKEVWRENIGKFGHPSGEGYANNGYYYLPMTSASLLQIDIRHRSISKVVKTDGVLGNLICYRGDVISHGVDRVAVFPQDVPSRIAIQNAEAAGPLSSDQLALKAQLLMQDNRLRDAAATMAEAYDADPNRRNEAVLIDLIISLLESDYEFGASLASRYENRFESSQRPRFLAAEIDGLIRNKARDKAFDLVAGLLLPTVKTRDELSYLVDFNHTSQGPTDAVFQQIGSGGERTVRFDRWLQARLSDLVQSAAPDTRDRYLSEINQLVDSSEISSINERLRLIELAGPRFLSSELLTKYATDLSKTDFRFVVPTLLQSEDSISRLADEIRSILPESLAETRWNSGMVTSEVSLAADDELALWKNTSRSEIRICESDNRFFDQFQVRFDGISGECELIDPFGKSIVRMPTRNTSTSYPINSAPIPGEARISGFLMLVNIGTEIFAIDLYKALTGQDGLLWSHEISRGNLTRLRFSTAVNIWGEWMSQVTPYSTTTAPVRASAPDLNGCCYLDENRLVCVDALSGEMLWQRSNILPGSVLLGDEDHVIVWNEQHRIAVVYDKSEGRLISQNVVDPKLGAMWETRGNSLLLSGTKPIEDEIVGNLPEQEEVPDFEPVEAKIYKTMTLFDCVKNESVWSREFDDKTVACRVRNEKLAALLPDGNLELIDFQTGQTESVTATGIPANELSRAENIELVETADAYLLRFHNTDSRSTSFMNSSNVRLQGNRYQQFWNGYLVSIDRKTRQPTWSAPAKIQAFNYAQDQPYAAPIQLLFRKVENRNTRLSWSQVIALDLRNGRVMGSAQTSNANSSDYRVEAFPDEQLISLYLKDRVVSFKVGTETPPPRPVAFLTSDNSVELSPRPSLDTFVAKKLGAEKRRQLLERIESRQQSLQGRRQEMLEKMQKQNEVAGPGSK
jgi:outer membrane protein assembly factor BamB